MGVPTRHHLGRDGRDKADDALIALFGLEHFVAVILLIFLLVVLLAAHVVAQLCRDQWLGLDNRRRNNHLLGGPAGR